MKISGRHQLAFAILLVLSPDSKALISRQECVDQGGEVVGDVGDGAIFETGYLCEINSERPTDFILVQDDEPIDSEGEVCCGGSGDGVGGNQVNVSLSLPETTDAADREEITRQECTDLNGTIIGDIGDGSTQSADYQCDTNGRAPVANIAQDENSLAIEGEVCCGPPVTSMVNSSASDLADGISRQDCQSQGGEIVQDIGDGSTFRDGYICEGNGKPPLAKIVPLEGESIAREGEVCCGLPLADGEAAGSSSEALHINTQKTCLAVAFATMFLVR